MENYKSPTWILHDGWWHQTPIEQKSLQKEGTMHQKYFNGHNLEEMEHKVFSAEVKGFDDQNLVVTHFISTERVDRGGDIMMSDGMKISGRVVVLLAHGFSNLGQEPIAKPINIWKDSFKGNQGIAAKTQFYDGSHLTPPDNTGRRLFEKAKEGYLVNWSIGYIPLKWELEKINGQEVRRVLEWELLEYSPVGVPMNPDCQNTEKCGGLCQKEAWFKVLPNVSDLMTKSFEHYRPAPKPEEIKVHLGKNQWCKLSELPGKLEAMTADLVRREIRKAQGKVD